MEGWLRMNIIFQLLNKVFGKFTPIVVGIVVIGGIGFGYYQQMGWKQVQGEVIAANNYCTIIKEVDSKSFWGVVKNFLPRKYRNRNSHVESMKMECAKAEQTLQTDAKWVGGNVAHKSEVTFKYISPFNGKPVTGKHEYDRAAKAGDKILIRASGLNPSGSYPI